MKPSPMEIVLQGMEQNWAGPWTSRERSLLMIQRIARLAQDNANEALRHFDLTFTEFEVLCALRNSAPPHILLPSDLYNTVLISSGSLTKVLKTLEEGRLIERPESEGDGRTRPVALTRRGVTLIESAAKAVREADAAILEDTSTDGSTYDRLEPALRAVIDILEKHAAR